MKGLAERISEALSVLIGKPIFDCWRVANMQIFEFGECQKILNRRGCEVEVADWKLHLQCRWRMVDGESIVFGNDDLYYPADEKLPWDEFDWDKQESVLDLRQQEWFAINRDKKRKVTDAIGDIYGGFQIKLEGGFRLEAFPCKSFQDEHCEQWRLFESESEHFVIDGDGVRRH